MSETTRGSSRRRRRSPRPQPAPRPQPSGETSAEAAPHAEPQPHPEPPVRAAQPKPRRRPRDAEGGLRELIGGGKSQLGVDKALRGRDVNRPTDADLDAAERDIAIVRRHWTPPTT